MKLDASLLDAHARGDNQALVALYTVAADQSGDADAACFYLTHAYIFALEQNHPTADALYLRLKAKGRV